MTERENNKILQDGISSLDIEIETLIALKKSLDDQFTLAIQKILKCKGRVVLTGVGKSAIIAQKQAASFNSTGTPSIFLHAGDAIHGDIGMIDKLDVCIVYSKSGNTPEIKVLVRMIKEFGNSIISIHSNKNSYLDKEADVSLYVPVDKEADPNNLAPTASTLAQMAMGDAMTVALIKAKGFTRDHFARFHPGGSLGKELFLKVSNVIQSDKKPAVTIDASIKEVIIEISSKRLGATAVLNHKSEVVGIITDGDLRRMLQSGKDASRITAADIMSENPQQIQEDELAANAISILRQHNISQLIVRNNLAYIGIVHIHDIIKEGIR